MGKKGNLVNWDLRLLNCVIKLHLRHVRVIGNKKIMRIAIRVDFDKNGEIWAKWLYAEKIAKP